MKFSSLLDIRREVFLRSTSLRRKRKQGEEKSQKGERKKEKNKTKENSSKGEQKKKKIGKEKKNDAMAPF